MIIFSFDSPNEIEIHYLLLHNYWFKCLVKTATNLSKYQKETTTLDIEINFFDRLRKMKETI